MPHREYDIILLGATGFTGRFAASHLSQSTRGLAWAVAGRSEIKLKKLVEELAIDHGKAPDVIELEFTEHSLAQLARKTRCLISTVGPFPRHGVLPFKTCAENGTAYVDVNGETPSILDVVEDYHEVAKSTGAIMIPSCGIGSLPADLLTFLMVERVKDTFNVPVSAALVSVHEAKILVSGGSLDGVVTAVSSYGLKKMVAATKPWALSPVRPAEARGGVGVSEDTIQRIGLGTLGFGMTATHDQALVQRTWGLLQQAKDTGADVLTYGPNFSFQSVQRYPSRIHGWLFWVLVWAISILPGVFPPLRWLVKWLAPPGSGPTEEERKKNFIEYRGVAIADFEEGKSDTAKPSKRQRGVHAKMRYDGDSYVFSGVMAAEAAMAILESGKGTLAHELKGGVLTPAMLGRPLAERLARAGVQFEFGVLL